MKTPDDPRHKKRQELVQELFKREFHRQRISVKAQEIFAEIEKIDRQIEKAASEYPIDKINKVDLAVLRLAIFELLIEKKVPKNVVVDEAVELAKEFGNDTSPSFINGALGKIMNYEKTS